MHYKQWRLNKVALFRIYTQSVCGVLLLGDTIYSFRLCLKPAARIEQTTAAS